MTRRVVEKLCTKKVCVDFFGPYNGVMQQHAILRRVLRRFLKGWCFLEEFLEGACKSFQ